MPREDLQAAQARVRELETHAAARAADMAPALALAATREEARRLREACARLEDGARRAAAAEAGVAGAKEEAAGAVAEARRLRGCLAGAVPRAAAEAAEAQLEGLAAEVAWLRRLVTSMAQVLSESRARLRVARAFPSPCGPCLSGSMWPAPVPVRQRSMSPVQRPCERVPAGVGSLAGD